MSPQSLRSACSVAAAGGERRRAPGAPGLRPAGVLQAGGAVPRRRQAGRPRAGAGRRAASGHRDDREGAARQLRAASPPPGGEPLLARIPMHVTEPHSIGTGNGGEVGPGSLRPFVQQV